jgi:hypothetical protein
VLSHAAHSLCHGVTNGTAFYLPELAEIGEFSFVFSVSQHFRPTALELHKNHKQFNPK